MLVNKKAWKITFYEGMSERAWTVVGDKFSDVIDELKKLHGDDVLILKTELLSGRFVAIKEEDLT
jgi:hypothetical protein